jgi:hypothetical protein
MVAGTDSEFRGNPLRAGAARAILSRPRPEGRGGRRIDLPRPKA